MSDYNKLNEKVLTELRKAENIHKISVGGIEPQKAILFFLEKLNTGNYYGTIALKITGTQVQNPKELEVTHRLETKFE